MSELRPQPAFPATEPQDSSSAALVYLTFRNILLRREQAAPSIFSSILDVAAQTLKLRATEADIDVRLHPGQSRIVES
jgi:hypothetical protein